MKVKTDDQSRALSKFLSSLGVASSVAILPPKPPIHRSPKWPAVRKKWLAEHPTCAACGTKKSLEVHHIQPFHLNPELELDPTNFMTLCESVHICHFTFGHFFDWLRFNPNVRIDAPWFLNKVTSS